MASNAVYVFLGALILGASASGPTNIFINQVPEYSSLATCAEDQLSTIVRGMYSGCGDNKQTTSFACFCSSSSEAFDTIISSAVVSQCSNDTQPATQVSSALEVFASYCALGASTTATTTSASTTQTATPASTASSASSTTTPSSSASSTPSGGAIAGIVVACIILVVASIAAIFFVLRKRRTQGGPRNKTIEADNKAQASEFSPYGGLYVKVADQIHEMGSPGAGHVLGELDGRSAPAELDARGIKY